MEYDNAQGIFSPDGRLFPVEYAQQASEQGSLVVFSTSSDKVCVSIEQKSHNKMLIEQNKLYKIDTGIYYTYSGLKPDALKILNHAILICRNYKLKTGEDISIEKLAYDLSVYKQTYTVKSSMRPFGVRSIVMSHRCVFIVEPDGNFSEYRSGAVGQKSVKICEYLEKCENEDLVYRSVSGLGLVVQSDKNKIKSYLIEKDGVRDVEESVVKEIIKSVSV